MGHHLFLLSVNFDASILHTHTSYHTPSHSHSYEEERAWLDERRRKRVNRKSLFDVEPTPEQLAMDEARTALEARADGGGSVYGNIPGRTVSALAAQPQQTRHARRLYVGNIPDVSDEQLHHFFRDAIRSSIILDSNSEAHSSHKHQYVDNDPIISVYINRERRFAFLEFKTMEITTACMALDGLDVMGRGKVKIKRPNDYNPAVAPMLNASTMPVLDTGKLGIISMTVHDGPNKIFVGGLPYHLVDSQVLELLSAFGAVKAFNLVKNDPMSDTSKGYCFVEYCDPNVTQIAAMGLNGMDMGGGKVLSARLSSQHGQETEGGEFGAPVAAPPVDASVVDGVDVNALLQAALGGGGAMPAAAPVAIQQPYQQLIVVKDPMAVANAAASALDQAFGSGGVPPLAPPTAMPGSTVTRILVLLNMVMDEDLATAEDRKFLEEEVREEVGKYGTLLSMKIPMPHEGCAPSAVKKIFLEYATPAEAMYAEKELKGRAFGPNVVDASYFSEEDYAKNQLS
eukprot:scaffold1559_cov193-Alexandrium_tamarense.AAC.23